MWQLYYAILRAFSPAARILFHLYNKVFTVRRTRVALLRPDGAVLLVKNSLGGEKWTLPGGGVGRGELDKAAACREVHEELGVCVEPSELENLGVLQMKDFVAPLFSVHLDAQRAEAIVPRRLEIQDWRWVTFDNLPVDTQRVVYHARDRLSDKSRLGRMGK